MATVTSTPIATNSDLEQLAERVDRAIAEVRALPPEAQAKALALKGAIEEFHKLGLTKIVQRLKDDPRGNELLLVLRDDPTSHAFYTMQGLFRSVLRTRVARVLDMVRPYMQSHGGDVELVDVTPSTVHVRMSGSCNGCSMSAVTLRNTVEEAIREHLPQIQSVEVVPNEPEPQSGFVPLDMLSGPPKVEPGWAVGPLPSEVLEAQPFRWDVEGTCVLIVRFHNQLQAFRNECAHLGMPLDGGKIDPETGVLTCPWHGFRFDCTNGECITGPRGAARSAALARRKGQDPREGRVVKNPVWLGAYSPGGLALPAAQPTKSQLYAPRGVYFDDEYLVVADSGNHRILLWRGLPDADGAEADIVLGQADFISEGPKLLHLPTDVLIHDGRLIVADAWHHRVLVWNKVPARSGVKPDYAIGQSDLNSVEPNRGEAGASARSLYWPYGIGFAAGWFWIADTGNRRVFGWRDVPQPDEPAQVVLGQNSAHNNEENRGAASGVAALVPLAARDRRRRVPVVRRRRRQSSRPGLDTRAAKRLRCVGRTRTNELHKFGGAAVLSTRAG